jgi:hypothetical protein
MFSYHIIGKMPKVSNKESILKAARDKCQVTNKHKFVRSTSDPSPFRILEILKARKVWNDISSPD